MFNPEDLIITTFRAGHQSPYTSENKGVKVHHIPTGIYVSCGHFESKFLNYADALKKLRYKVEAVLRNSAMLDKAVNSKGIKLEDFLLDTKRVNDILSEIRNNHILAEESALKEYFLEVHGIDVSDLITLSKSVNNLKFKHFEKRVCLNTHKYYFKNELFMAIDYMQDEMIIQKLWK